MPKPVRSQTPQLSKGLTILYEDRDLLVVNKPAGLLTIAAESGGSLTAYSIVTHYVRKGQARSRNRVFIIHRLDRDTSGVLLFAKNEETKRRLQAHWDETHKKYLAAVHGTPQKKSDTITSYLAENKAQVVYSTPDPTKGKLSHTAYKVLRQTKAYTLLEVELLTGRKNQIRVQLADIGHPIVGDRKYGRPNDTHTELYLHAHSITFNHPQTGHPLTFDTDPPSHFNKLVGNLSELNPAQQAKEKA